MCRIFRLRQPIAIPCPPCYHRGSLGKEFRHRFRVPVNRNMIYAKKRELSRYLGISPAMDTAIRYLETADLRALSMGRNVIDGDQVFVNRFNYQTMPAEQAMWEGHIQYADIHVLLSGQERIGVSHVSGLTETVRKPEEDFVGFTGPVQTWVPMTTEDILIVFPEDIHMVKVQFGDSCPVEKACFKVKV